MVELLGPQHAGERLALHEPGIRIGVSFCSAA